MNKLYVVGIGPGDYEDMTVRAINALSACDVIIGYQVYVDLVKAHFPEKAYFTTPMHQEVERCRLALEMARSGKIVAMICSGDSGIYGMAGLILELRGADDSVQVEIVCGLTAACSGAALLGAPLAHDFVVISLSDLMTPWETIARRLECASKGNFAIVLYNPGSTHRKDYLKRACHIIMQYASDDTICGVVRNIGRAGETAQIMTLKDLSYYEPDMFTTVFIGNDSTKDIAGSMVTPRGYRNV